jgi:hypothetical protein
MVSQRPEADTQWITYSQRAELPSEIKSNFATWTRLGLFTISTPTHHLSLAVDAWPARSNTNLRCLIRKPTTCTRRWVAYRRRRSMSRLQRRPRPQTELRKRLQGAPLSRNALSCQLSRYRRRAGVSVAWCAVPDRADAARSRRQPLPLASRAPPLLSTTMSFASSISAFRPKGVRGGKARAMTALACTTDKIWGNPKK